MSNEPSARVYPKCPWCPGQWHGLPTRYCRGSHLASEAEAMIERQEPTMAGKAFSLWGIMVELFHLIRPRTYF